MGSIRFGVPKDIVLFIKGISRIELFVETGTYRGLTSCWAANHFKLVKTIEYSTVIFDETRNKYSKLPNVEFIFGDSRIELKNIVDLTNEAAIIWLDAHWCSFDTYGESDQCPLLEELEIIIESKSKHIILIDDARLFLCPPPLPHSIKYYPSISEIISKFIKMKYHTIIYDDVFICVPFDYKDEVISYIQKKVTKEEVENVSRIKRYRYIKIVARFIKKIIRYN